jgi:hypothetical protein
LSIIEEQVEVNDMQPAKEDTVIGGMNIIQETTLR